MSFEAFVGFGLYAVGTTFALVWLVARIEVLEAEVSQLELRLTTRDALRKAFEVRS